MCSCEVGIGKNGSDLIMDVLFLNEQAIQLQIDYEPIDIHICLASLIIMKLNSFYTIILLILKKGALKLAFSSQQYKNIQQMDQNIIYLGSNKDFNQLQGDDGSEPEEQPIQISNSKSPIKQSQKIPKSQIPLYIGTLMLVILALQLVVAYFQMYQKITPIQHILREQQRKKLELIYQIGHFENEIQKIKEQIAILNSELKKPQAENMNAQMQNENSLEIFEINKSDEFIIPKYVWIYLNNDVDIERYLTKLCFDNIKYFAQKSNFELLIVSRNSYKKWLNSAQSVQLEDYIKRIEAQPNNEGNLNFIREQTIMLYLMKVHGGVKINSKFILAEPLDWLKTIHKAVHVNRGNKNIKPKYFAFFNIDQGSKWENKDREADYNIEKRVFTFPGIKDGFLAGIARGSFLQDMFKYFIELAESSPDKRNQIINNYDIQKGSLDPSNEEHIYALSAHLAIQQKQKQLNSHQNQKYFKFAIDYYGLITMNENYAPRKMEVLFNNRLGTRNYFDNFYNLLAKLPMSEFEEIAGPLRYVINPQPFDNQFNSRLVLHKNNEGYDVWEGSFIHRLLYLGSNVYTKPNKEKSKIPTKFNQWKTLPRKLWLFSEQQLQNASAANQLCALNMIKNAELAGFEVIKVNKNNIRDFIHEVELNRIQQTLKNAKFQASDTIRSHFLQLALIFNHGGILMDASYVWLQSFDWFVNIAKEQTHYIFNRFGEHPKVMLQFHCLEGGPFNWQVDEQSNTKTAWHLAYESNFIAAEKQSQLLKQWYNLFHLFVISQFSSVENRLLQCNTNDYRWISAQDRSLLMIDALKTVIGCRQKMIEAEPSKYSSVKNAADYYKVWSINGFTGLQKFRYYNDYTFSFNDDIDNDPHSLYESSIEFNDATIGKVYKGIKLYQWNIHFLNIYLQKSYGTNFETDSHPNSYFNKYMFNKNKHQFYKTDHLHVRTKQ